MLVPDFEIIITKTFPAALMMSPFGFYCEILKLVYTMSSCGAMVSARSRKSAISIETSLTDCDLKINMCRVYKLNTKPFNSIGN